MYIRSKYDDIIYFLSYSEFYTLQFLLDFKWVLRHCLYYQIVNNIKIEIILMKNFKIIFIRILSNIINKLLVCNIF